MSQQADYAKAAKVSRDDIPVINVSARHDPAGRAEIAAHLYQAAANTGFFYLAGHGISTELQAGAFAASKAFFNLDAADKASITVNQDQRGWMAAGQTNLEGAKTHDQKEVFFWGYDVGDDDEDVQNGVPLVVPNLWPTEKASFLKPAIMPYYTEVLALGRDILSLLAVGMGHDEAIFTDAYRKPLGRGQLVYYPEMNSDDFSAERFGAAAHSDFGVLTILMQDQLGGLQIASKEGGWIEAPPIPNTFVCNIGDLLEMWTGGKLKSTLHRVINRAAEARYSIPIFCDPASKTVIDPSLFGGAPSKTPITAGEYIISKNKRNFAHYQKK